MNQFKRLNDLDKWIKELTFIYKLETVGEKTIVSAQEGMYKKQLTDIDRFMFSFGELFQLSKEKERLLAFCEEWRAELLKNMTFLESSEWEELNKRMKRFEQRKISNGVFLTANTYFEWCFCCLAFYSEIQLFAISKNENEITEFVRDKKENTSERVLLQYKLNTKEGFNAEFTTRLKTKTRSEAFDELQEIMNDAPDKLTLYYKNEQTAASAKSRDHKRARK